MRCARSEGCTNAIQSLILSSTSTGDEYEDRARDDDSKREVDRGGAGWSSGLILSASTIPLNNAGEVDRRGPLLYIISSSTGNTVLAMYYDSTLWPKRAI